MPDMFADNSSSEIAAIKSSFIPKVKRHKLNIS